MDDLDSIVKRLAEVTDELLATSGSDFQRRFDLSLERDELRAKAKVFHEGRDSRRSIFDLQAELAERRKQLSQMRKSKINMAYQAQARGGGSHVAALSSKYGGTLNNALMRGQGSERVFARIAEIEQELTRRGYDPKPDQTTSA
ncbi:MAG: hypothetical protein P8N50_10765 [Actinomycetota bacterium]|jgi:hypothetical protein|nr:hypothetical protein [Actinomycetota bacterium]